MEVETVKSFASRQDDKFRVAYGTVVESHPRQCVICGTSNSQHFLRDVTGNRRFWPVQVTGECEKHPWNMDKALLEQIWAEALTLYNAGEELILKGTDAEMAAEKQQEALEMMIEKDLCVNIWISSYRQTGRSCHFQKSVCIWQGMSLPRRIVRA